MTWGSLDGPGFVSEQDAMWLDQVAALLAAADQDPGVEDQLWQRYRDDEDLHPGATVIQASSTSDHMQTVDLDRPTHVTDRR